jgi:hypothetical protein
VSAPLGVIALIAGVVICVWSADLLVDGLLGTGRKLGIAPFALTVDRGALGYAGLVLLYVAYLVIAVVIAS